VSRNALFAVTLQILLPGANLLYWMLAGIPLVQQPSSVLCRKANARSEVNAASIKNGNTHTATSYIQKSESLTAKTIFTFVTAT
jgi:hypothetical protein